MASDATKERILDTAERLFAQKGYAATSLREITRLASVNLAAVNYHFTSKDGLACAVFSRRMSPINDSRLARIDALERSARPGTPEVGAILHAFVEPLFDRYREDPAATLSFIRIIGRLYSEPVEGLLTMYERECLPVINRFRDALARALPSLSLEEVFWRLSFLVGMVAHTVMTGDRIGRCTDGLCSMGDAGVLVDRLVRFGTAGFLDQGVTTPANAPAVALPTNGRDDDD